jgi:predicted DNA-binding transcriptional regulator AlpA
MKQVQKTIEPRRLTHNIKSLIKKQIKSLYLNRQLTEFISEQLQLVPVKDRIALLYFMKKTVLQTYRCPDPLHYAAFKDEYEEMFSEIALEQIFYEPIRWIEAEIEYQLNTAERLTSADVEAKLDVMQQTKLRLSKDWLTEEEVMAMFDISKSTIKRRRAEGMPAHKKGKAIHFYLEEITEWMRKEKQAA